MDDNGGEKHFDTWGQLEKELLRMTELLPLIQGATPLLFRGQRKAGWELATTLDRRLGRPSSAERYYRVIASVKAEVETFTGKAWNLPDHGVLNKWTHLYDSIRVNLPPPGYEYLVYLRHHGFPSPLLDWSASPYVAAYFAVVDSLRTDTGNVAIYAFCEHYAAGKVVSSNAPQIVKLGSNVRSHSRHFLQQSQYTMCCQFLEGQWWFTSHDQVFKTPRDHSQDLLWKLTMPASERIKVLRQLDRYNLNAFSLFQGDEALLETLATREIDFQE